VNPLLLRRGWRMRLPGVEPARAYRVISDVEAYPNFLTAMTEARVVERQGDRWFVDNCFAIGPIEFRFRSQADLRPTQGLTISSDDGPWRRMTLDWRIAATCDGCVVEGDTELHFRSLRVAALARIAWPEIERRVLGALERRMREAEISP